MKSIVCAALEKRRLPTVSSLIKVVPQLVMNYTEIFFRDLDAHLHTHIIFRIDVPRARMAHYVAVGRLREKRSLPEGLRERPESQRGKKRLAVRHHSLRIRLSLLQYL